MADYYVDHGAYASALGTTPTWGVPQEGDGSTKDAATASSIGSILFGSVPTSGTISVCGASVSTTSVIGAATVDAAANALATNINATTATVNTTFARTNGATNANQLRNIVFARGPSGGAPAGTCQIMTRTGSATLNVTGIASSFDGSPTVTQFAGGSGGCWGWLFNNAAIGVSSSIAVYTYGIFQARSPTVWTAEPSVGDKIWVRTGSGKVLTASGAGVYVGLSGLPDYDANFIFDSNLKWTGDSGTGAVDIQHSGTSSNFFGFNANKDVNGTCRVRTYTAIKDGGFKLSFVGTVASSSFVVGISSAYTRFKRVHFIEESTIPLSSRYVLSELPTSYAGGAIFDDCLFDFKPAITTLKRNFFGLPSTNAAGYLEFNGCLIKYNVTGAGDPGALLTIPASLGNGVSIKVTNCDFSGYSGKYTLFSGALTGSSLFECVVDGCTGVKMDSALIGAVQYQSTARYENRHSLQYSSLDAGRAFRVETLRGVCDWVPDASPAFPTLNAIQPDGTAWSLRHRIFTTKAHNLSQPFYGPKLTQLNRLADAARTVLVEMLWPDGYTADAFSVALEVGYIDATGIARHETTYGEIAPATSTAAWTGASSYPNHSKKSLSLTTSYSVKQGTDVSVWLAVYEPAPSTLLELYFSPEFYLS